MDHIAVVRIQFAVNSTEASWGVSYKQFLSTVNSLHCKIIVM